MDALAVSLLLRPPCVQVRDLTGWRLMKKMLCGEGAQYAAGSLLAFLISFQVINWAASERLFTTCNLYNLI